MVASIELQKAIFSKLKTGIYPVYDALPLNTAMPYLVIGEESLLQNSTKTEKRTNHIVTIHSWSNKQGSMEIKTMNDFVINSIDDTLKVAGYTVDLVTLQFNQTIKQVEQDTYIYHGVTQINLTLTEV